MDTSWIDLPLGHPGYVDGCMQFIEFAKEGMTGAKTLCPCKFCKVEKWFPINEVERHILFKGFYKSYKEWIFHGKGDFLQRVLGNDDGRTSRAPSSNPTTSVRQDDTGGLLRSTFDFDRHPNESDIEAQENDESFYEPSYDEAEYQTHDFTTEKEEDASAKVKVNIASSSKSKVEVENDIVNELMYKVEDNNFNWLVCKDEVLRGQLNYGFGVKQSDIFGVQSFLRKERWSYVNYGAVEVENLKAALSTIKKQNEDLQQQNEALETKFNEMTHTFKVFASQLGEVLKAVRNGNASAQLLDAAESAIRMANSQISNVSSNN